MANLNLQEISSGASLDDTTLNNNINLLNTVPLTGTTLNNIPTFSEDEKITAKDINEAFAAIKDNWIDTSDATATENDMANSMTAYVNGEKITGNIPVNTGVYSQEYSTLGGGTYADGSLLFAPYHKISSDILMRSGSQIAISMPYSVFGDATAADVAAGKTFTSSAGLKVTGTASASCEYVCWCEFDNGLINLSRPTRNNRTFTITFPKSVSEIYNIYLECFDLKSDVDDSWVMHEYFRSSGRKAYETVYADHDNSDYDFTFYADPEEIITWSNNNKTLTIAFPSGDGIRHITNEYECITFAATVKWA